MKIKLSQKISIYELQQLNTFLATDHKDAKPLNLTQTHGFLCAIASAPSLIMPSKYQPVLLGGYPEFKSIEHAQSISSIILTLYNKINDELIEGKMFSPLLWKNKSVVDYDVASLDLMKQ